MALEARSRPCSGCPLGRAWDSSAVLARSVHLVGMDDLENRLGLEPLLGVTELAEYFGVPAQRIYDWRLTGVGPRGYRLGRELKFPVSEIRRWLAERDERPSSSSYSLPDVVSQAAF